MICPSCSETLQTSLKHCVRCGIKLSKRSAQLSAVLNNGGWILRRALGGAAASSAGWMLAIAVNRVSILGLTGADDPSLTDLLRLFPGQSPFSGAVAACCLGAVSGMIERSAYKSLLGGILGALGGILTGFAYPYLETIFRGFLYSYSFAMAASWGIAGAMIGATSGLLEGTKKKIFAGILGGFIGGAFGGGISSQMYGALLMDFGNLGKNYWWLGRALEGIAGGVMGLHVWIFIGAAEKLYIFQRRQLVGATKKVCDSCHFENGLNAWYCAECGSALQVAAAREQIHVTPFRGLERVSNAFQFLSWLSATLGTVTAAVVFFSFILQDFFFALFGSLIVALLIYSIAILFRAVSDSIRAATQIAEKLSRPGKEGPAQ